MGSDSGGYIASETASQFWNSVMAETKESETTGMAVSHFSETYLIVRLV